MNTALYVGLAKCKLCMHIFKWIQQFMLAWQNVSCACIYQWHVKLLYRLYAWKSTLSWLTSSTGGLRQGQCKLLYHTIDCSDGNRFTYHISHCIDHTWLGLTTSAIMSYNRWNPRLKGVAQLIMWYCMWPTSDMLTVDIYKCRTLFINVALTL